MRHIKKQMRTTSNTMVVIAMKFAPHVRAAMVAMFKVATDVLTATWETMGRLTMTAMANDKVPTAMKVF